MKPLPLYAEPPPRATPEPARFRNPPAAYRALEAVYRDLDREIARLAPRCDARGICCDFDRADHVLFASALEVDYVKDHVPRERWARPSGNRCPLLTGDGKCGAREFRMLGCRTYFCQPGWSAHAADLYERHYARLKAIAAEHGLPWRYAPALAQFRYGATEPAAAERPG